MFENNFKKGDKQPDHKLTMKIGDEFVEVGAAWKKEGKKGKFVSLTLNGTFTHTPYKKPEAKFEPQEAPNYPQQEDIPF